MSNPIILTRANPPQLRRLHVFGANADVDQPGWNAAQDRKPLKSLKNGAGFGR
jgi:hypothetical protein